MTIFLSNSVLLRCHQQKVNENEKIKQIRAQDKSSSMEKKKNQNFPGGAGVKNPPANAGDTGSSPGPRRSHMPRSN